MYVFASSQASRNSFLKVLSFAVLTSADLCGMSAVGRLLKFISPLVFIPKGSWWHTGRLLCNVSWCSVAIEGWEHYSQGALSGSPWKSGLQFRFTWDQIRQLSPVQSFTLTTLGLGRDTEPMLCSHLDTLLLKGEVMVCFSLELYFILILPSQSIKVHKVRAVVGIASNLFHRLG